MGRILLGVAAVAALLVLPRFVWSEDVDKREAPPGPRSEAVFKHLDANQDGVISEDEIPADAPEPLQALLKAADKDNDQKITLDEFTAAAKEHPLPRPPRRGMRGPGRDGPPDWPGPQDGMRRDGGPGDRMPPPGPPAMGGCPCMAHGHGRPSMEFDSRRPCGPPHDGSLCMMLDPKELFAKLDADKDGKLTIEEFTDGLKNLQESRPNRGPGGENRIMGRIDDLDARVKALEGAAQPAPGAKP